MKSNDITDQQIKHMKAYKLAEACSKFVGERLFQDGVHWNRINDVEIIKELISQAMKNILENDPDLDIDLVIYQIYSKAFINKLETVFKHLTSPTLVGLVSGGIYLNTNKVIPNISIITTKIEDIIIQDYKKVNETITPNTEKFNPKVFELVKSIKEQYNTKEVVDKWLENKLQKKASLEVGERKFDLNIITKEEISEDGKTFSIIHPIVDQKLLNEFAKDKEKGSLSLNEWLKIKIPEWKGEIVIADIRADVDSAYDIGASLRGINLSGSIITGLYLRDTDCRNMNLRDCNIKSMALDHCLYSGLDLRGADINNVMIDERKFDNKDCPIDEKEFEKDRDQGDHIFLSVANIESASANSVARSSLNQVSKRAHTLDPFYVRKGENNRIALEDRLIIKATKKDIEEYLETINQLEEVKNYKAGKTQSINWMSIPSFNDFIGKKHGYNTENINVFSDLSALNLSELDLTGANFSRTNLYKSYFGQTNAKGANFYGACLEGAILDKAILDDAIFNQANMQYVSLTEAKVNGANFNDANLERAKMKAIKGSFSALRANMRYANVEEAEIGYSKLNKMRAEGISLAKAHAEYCDLRGAELVRATLQDGYFEGANLQGAQMERLNATSANFYQAILKDIKAENANFTKTFLAEINAEGANFTGANLEKI